MQLKSLACGAAFAVALAPTAHAAVAIHTTPFIASPIASIDFEAIGSSTYPVNTAYSQGGVDVEFVGSGGPVVTNNFADGSHDFYTPGYGGYDDIKLTGGGSFNEVQFRAAVGFSSADVWYDVLLNGASIDSGNAGNLPFLTAQTLGFSGATFDEVRLQATQGESGFNPSASSALFLDDVKIGDAGAAPEPTTWALMLFGFGMVGMAMRRGGRAAPAFAS